MKTTLIEHNNELYLVSDEEKGVGIVFNNQINSFLASTQKYSPIGLIIPPNLMEVLKGDNKEKRFTLEDMKTAIVKALQFGREIKDKDLKGFVYEILPYTDKYLQSLSTQKKEWEVDIEMETGEVFNGLDTQKYSRPKLTKNSEGKESYTITNLIS